MEMKCLLAVCPGGAVRRREVAAGQAASAGWWFGLEKRKCLFVCLSVCCGWVSKGLKASALAGGVWVVDKALLFLFVEKGLWIAVKSGFIVDSFVPSVNQRNLSTDDSSHAQWILTDDSLNALYFNA